MGWLRGRAGALVILNLKLILCLPLLLASWTTTIKHPEGRSPTSSHRRLESPSTNPMNQWISCISESLTTGLNIGCMSGNDSLNFSDNPQFKLAFMLTNLKRPSIVKCCFFSIRSTDCLNKR